MASVNDILINIHSLVTSYIYNQLQYVMFSSDTYGHNRGHLIHKNVIHKALHGIAKMTSDIFQRRTFVFTSSFSMILQTTRSFNGS